MVARAHNLDKMRRQRFDEVEALAHSSFNLGSVVTIRQLLGQLVAQELLHERRPQADG